MKKEEITENIVFNKKEKMWEDKKNSSCGWSKATCVYDEGRCGITDSTSGDFFS